MAVPSPHSQLWRWEIQKHLNSQSVSGSDPPTSPSPGNFWFEDDTGKLYVWYQDINSAAWVEVPPGSGATGPIGLTGSTGPAGPANSLAIGTVTTVPVGGAATSTITGTSPTQTLNLGLPTGATGAQGIQGTQGNQGIQGIQGIQGVPGITGPPVVTVVLASTTYTKPAGLIALDVEGWGGGGAGAGCPVTAAAQASGGASGNGGAKAYVTLAASAIGATTAIVIGAGGVPGAAGAAGGPGGDTTFGALLSAKGGEAGPVYAAAAQVHFTSAGVSQSATGAIRGWTQRAGDGYHNPSVVAVYAVGGQTEWGGGVLTSSGNGPSGPANTGAGGGGSTNGASIAAARIGGAGGSGIMILKEYF